MLTTLEREIGLDVPLSPETGAQEDLQTEVDSMYSDMQNRKSKLKYALNKDNVVNIVDRDK